MIPFLNILSIFIYLISAYLPFLIMTFVWLLLWLWVLCFGWPGTCSKLPWPNWPKVPFHHCFPWTFHYSMDLFIFYAFFGLQTDCLVGLNLLSICCPISLSSPLSATKSLLLDVFGNNRFSPYGIVIDVLSSRWFALEANFSGGTKISRISSINLIETDSVPPPFWAKYLLFFSFLGLFKFRVGFTRCWF